MGQVVGIAAVLLLPVAYAIWQRPQRGVLLLLALVPFDGLLLLIDAPGPLAGWKEALLGGTLLAAVHARGRAGRDTELPGVPLWVWPLAVLAALAVLSVAWSPPLQALVGLKIMFFGALTAAVVWLCPLTESDRHHAVTVLASTGIVVALVGLGQQFVGHERLHEMGYAYNSVIRFTGGFMRSWSTFNQPFGFAFFLMVVTLVAGSVALADTARLRNRVILAAVPLFLAGMAVAVVRAAWIGLLAGLIYLAVTRHRVLLAAAPLVLGSVVIALVMGAAGFFSPPSVDARFSRWQALPAVMSAAPFGEGIGTAGAAAAKTETIQGGTPTFDPTRVSNNTRVVFQPDNNYVKLLYELGVIGLGLFVMALLFALAGTRQAETDAGAGAFASGVSALIIAAAVASLAASFFEIFPLDYVFWLVVGVATTGPIAPARAPALQRPAIAV